MSIKELSEAFGVDLKQEPYLQPLASQLNVLPPGWSVSPSGEYTDANGTHHEAHPGKAYFDKVRATRLASKSSDQPATVANSTTSYFPPIQSSAVVSNSASMSEPWMAGHVPPPERVHFKCWFHESGSTRSPFLKREVVLEHAPLTGEFSVKIKGTENLYVLSHINDLKTGRPLTYLDLHVGAVVDILGKRMTLRQANLATSTWLEKETLFLESQIKSISSDLRRYGVRTPTCSTAATPHVMRRSEKRKETKLRALMVELSNLYSSLDDLRPKAASEWANRSIAAGRSKLRHEEHETKREEERSLARSLKPAGLAFSRSFTQSQLSASWSAYGEGADPTKEESREV